jgi:two-component system, LuxR family, response regulator FixJ
MIRARNEWFGPTLLEDGLSENKPIVILVEDDPSVLRALVRLIESAGFEVRAFDRPSALTLTAIPDKNACFVFDVHLPEMSGVALFQTLAASNRGLPLILITGHADASTRALTESINPVAVLLKPFSRESLLAALRQGLTSQTGAE